MNSIRKILNKNFIQNNNGFTLVEALVTTFIFSLLLGGIYAAAAAGDNTWQANSVRITLQQETRKAMEGMINELRQAGDSSIVNVLSNGTWYTSIVFKIPSGVTSGSIGWNASTIQYALGGTGGKQLIRTTGAPTVTTRIVGDNFQTLRFRRQASTPKILEVSLVGQKNTVKKLPISYNLDFNIELRN